MNNQKKKGRRKWRRRFQVLTEIHLCVFYRQGHITDLSFAVRLDIKLFISPCEN